MVETEYEDPCRLGAMVLMPQSPELQRFLRHHTDTINFVVLADRSCIDLKRGGPMIPGRHNYHEKEQRKGRLDHPRMRYSAPGLKVTQLAGIGRREVRTTDSP